MHTGPQGRLLISALLGDSVKTVIAYDAKRIGRTQPAFWSFVGLCRDNGITMLDASGTDLTGSVMGGVNEKWQKWTETLRLPACQPGSLTGAERNV